MNSTMIIIAVLVSIILVTVFVLYKYGIITKSHLDIFIENVIIYVEDQLDKESGVEKLNIAIEFVYAGIPFLSKFFISKEKLSQLIQNKFDDMAEKIEHDNIVKTVPIKK